MECIVCFTHVTNSRLGLNCCRACAVFYKRAIESNAEPKCRNGAGICMLLNPKSTCRLCRFTKIKKVLESASEDPGSSVKNAVNKLGVVAEKKSFVLDRLKTQYRAMCHTRLIGELNARGEAPHPLRINADKEKLLPATFKSFQSGNRIFIASALEFGSTAFPEFNRFTDDEKWAIITEFFYRFKYFEGCFRANSYFPDQTYRFLPTYTTYVSPETHSSIIQGLPPNADLCGAEIYFTRRNFERTYVAACRNVISKLNPHHEEFLAVMGLMFWSLDDAIVSAEISAVAEHSRAAIMRELHAFYRDTLKLANYATRLGELLMFLQIFDMKDNFKEHHEMLRLLNIVDDDTLVYKFRKD